MIGATVISECKQSGVTLGLDDHGGLTVRGDNTAVSRLLPKIREHKPELIRLLAGKPPAALGADLDTLAAKIANEFKVRPADVLALLDADDRVAIRAGSDPGRAEAWRCAIASLVQLSEWKPAVPDSLVTCSTCQNATPAVPGVIDCAAKISAPGACGPFRWYAADIHVCGLYSKKDTA